MRLGLETLEGQTAFGPGDVIDGLATWELAHDGADVEVRLIWYTSGKGTRDCGVADRVRFDSVAPSDVQGFSFVAPAGPWSFSGRLVTIAWAIELAASVKKRKAVRLEIVIAPGRSERRPLATDEA